MTQYVRSERRNALSTELLLRRLQRHHGAKLPAVILPNPLIENYRNQRADNLKLCVTTFGKVTVAVCQEFGVSRDQLLAGSRKKVAALPRQVAMYLMLSETRRSEHSIADLFNRDHTCVRLAKRKIPKMLGECRTLAHRVRNITVAIRNAA